MFPVRHIGRRIANGLHRGLATVGLQHSESRIASDAQRYWGKSDSPDWRSNSHWRDGDTFTDSDLWSRIGSRHLEMFERGARANDLQAPWRRVVDWGCGGGANAVHFAPRAQELVGVDVAAETLDECRRQCEAAGASNFRPVLIDVAHPETAVGEIESCDVFLCFYVFELVPTPEYGERILRIAERLLVPGGLALIQIKYDTGTWRTRPRRRRYDIEPAEMTTYPIAQFWEIAQRCGLTPQSIELIPKDEVDERSAYFFLSKK